MQIKEGDTAIKLGGCVYLMRPAMEALWDIEESTGKSIPALATELSRGIFAVGDLCCIVHRAIHAAHSDAPDMEAIGNLMIDGGIFTILAPIADFLAVVLDGMARIECLLEKLAARQQTGTAATIH